MDTGSIEIKKKTAIPTTPTPLTGSLGTGIRTPWAYVPKNRTRNASETASFGPFSSFRPLDTLGLLAKVLQVCLVCSV